MECNRAFIHVITCKGCFETMQKYISRLAAARAGSTTGKAKARAARENGKLGGRPKKWK